MNRDWRGVVGGINKNIKNLHTKLIGGWTARSLQLGMALIPLIPYAWIVSRSPSVCVYLQSNLNSAATYIQRTQGWWMMSPEQTNGRTGGIYGEDRTGQTITTANIQLMTGRAGERATRCAIVCRSLPLSSSCLVLGGSLWAYDDVELSLKWNRQFVMRIKQIPVS